MPSEILRGQMDANKTGNIAFEQLHLISEEQHCSAELCEESAIIVLGKNSHCLQHFIARCYAWLDQLEPVVREKPVSTAAPARIRALVQECSNRALLVSLRCESLTNLDRSRLLDILLRSSDLLFALRMTGNVSAWLLAEPSISAKRPRSKNGSAELFLQANKMYGT